MNAGIGEGHAGQLGRTLGILKVMQDSEVGKRYAVIGEARRLLSERAESVDREVNVQEFDGIGAPELRTVARVCSEGTEYFDDRDDKQRLVAVAEFATERLEEDDE